MSLGKPFLIYRGAAFERKFTHRVAGTNTPVSWLGATPEVRIRMGTQTFTYTQSSGGLVNVDLQNGTFSLVIDESETSNLPVGEGSLVVLLMQSNGRLRRLAGRKVQIRNLFD
jgi:hypothetical protein